MDSLPPSGTVRFGEWIRGDQETASPPRLHLQVGRVLATRVPGSWHDPLALFLAIAGLGGGLAIVCPRCRSVIPLRIAKR